tara:strand:+ start:41529 stop:42623 length:1095 start_codon:yes stop_codon:yes gene_type:complete
MKKQKTAYLFFVFTLYSITGCAAHQLPRAQSQAEFEAGYTYIPLDAFPVKYSDCDKKETIDKKEFFEYLPDNSIRTSIRQFDLTNGKLTILPVALSGSGYSYEVTSDYINSDTIGMDIVILRTAIYGDTRRFVVPFEQLQSSYECSSLVEGSSVYYAYTSEEYETFETKSDSSASGVVDQAINHDEYYSQKIVYKENLNANAPENINPKLIQAKGSLVPYKVSIPVYIGIGLRVKANVASVSSGINVSGVSALTMNAETSSLQGTLTVQTLGVNGSEISGSLPQDDELNRTTVRAALTSVATIRAKLYQENTIVQPRVLGIYLPIAADRQLVNAIVSLISKSPPEWKPTRIVISSPKIEPQPGI